MSTPPLVLRGIANAIVATIEHPTPTEARFIEALAELAARLDNATFQLAVLGQFKRGKSTLINALIGQPLLATDVLPVTAIPTFLTAGDEYGITTIARNGERAHRAAPDLDALKALVAATTTEAENPGNTLDLDRVLLTLPAEGCLTSLTLVDTPGIGSTHRHNTEAAHGVLQQCDAALFVLSVDPPITEAELDYLAAVCRVMKTVIPVMNKRELVREDELARIVSFMTRAVAERPDTRLDPTIFPLSARTALDARSSADEKAFARSGVLALETYLRDDLAARKQALLAGSVGRKMLAILDGLRAETALRLQALALPLDQLDLKLEALERSEAQFERERERLSDGLQGEWRRTLSKLETLCAEADATTSAEIAALSTEDAHTPGVLEARIETLFADAFARLSEALAAHVAGVVEHHQSRYSILVANVRRAASDILDVPSTPTLEAVAPAPARKPYWVGRAEVDDVGSLTMDGVFRLLPRPLRTRRRANKRRRAIERALMKNLTGLHWTAKQSIDDTFRQLLAAAASSVDTSLHSTRDIVAATRSRRLDAGKDAAADIDLLEKRGRALNALSERLGAIVPV